MQIGLVDKTLTTDQQTQDFLYSMENLILNTTDRALNVTTNVYKQLTAQMPTELCHEVCEIMMQYRDAVESAQQQNANYTEKRKLFTYFRQTNDKIEKIKKKLNSQATAYNYQLISDEFYIAGRNSTKFDNLYLDFMQQFEMISQNLWRTLGERMVEDQQELLEILDEISKEKELKERDKLYDEFIEMFLFKKKPDEEILQM